MSIRNDQKTDIIWRALQYCPSDPRFIKPIPAQKTKTSSNQIKLPPDWKLHVEPEQSHYRREDNFCTGYLAHDRQSTEWSTLRQMLPNAPKPTGSKSFPQNSSHMSL